MKVVMKAARPGTKALAATQKAAEKEEPKKVAMKAATIRRAKAKTKAIVATRATPHKAATAVAANPRPSACPTPRPTTSRRR